MGEFRPILRHASTVLVGQLSVIAFGVTDTLIAGHLSPQSLATLSLASAIYISIYVALNGLVQALLPIWSQLHGAGAHLQLGQSVRQSLYIGALAAGVGITALCAPGPWLDGAQVPQALRLPVQHYLLVQALAIVPSLLFRVYSTLNQSMGQARWVTGLQMAGLALKVPLSVVMALGIGPWTGLGVVGCAWASLAVNVCMLAAGVCVLRRHSQYRALDLWRRPEPIDWPQCRHFLALGVPASLSIMVEVTSFTFMALFIARMGEVALASHHVAANMAAVLYMVPLSLGIATSARVGHWMGAQQDDRARQTARTGLAMAMGVAVLCAATLAWQRQAVAHAFTQDPEVAAAAAVWLLWVCAYHLADAVQAVCVFVLRCWRITLGPLVAYTALLWGVGLWGGHVLAYSGIGPWAAQATVDRFWMASAAALAAVAVWLWARLEWAMRRPQAPMPR